MANNVFYKDAEEKFVRTVILYAKSNTLYADANCTITPDASVVFNAYVNGCLKIMENNGSTITNGILTPTNIYDGDGYIDVEVVKIANSTVSGVTYSFTVDNAYPYFNEYR